MALFIEDRCTETTVKWLARLQNMSATDVVRMAIENDCNRVRNEFPLIERLAILSKLYRAYPETKMRADKVFFDDLSGDSI
ncbi:type II toxin-antitoxin system VapB family antitoxin [Phyllobacterium sp. 22229]|uniref:type II toxin-antitoxin system VapB family antitoxin n=1 Tax=Phyllobacterium sp. 22229 TaxID=3453895 RepID=UPI003F87BBD5